MSLFICVFMYLNVSFENRSKNTQRYMYFWKKQKIQKISKNTCTCLLACLLAGWLAGLLAGWLAGWLACVRACLLAVGTKITGCPPACLLAALLGCSVAQLLNCSVACWLACDACLLALLACLLACLPLPAAFNDGERMIGGKKPGGRGKGEKKTVKIRYPSCEDPTRISTRSSLKDLCRIMQAPLKEKFSRSRHAHEHLSKAILCKNLQQE